jgi:zona occludens toxin
VRETDKEFLAEHRHMVGDNGFSTEIYFVTQDLSQIASFARSLVETTYRMVKRSNIGLDKRFRVDVYLGPVTGPRPSPSLREREIHGGKFSDKVYKYYLSHTKSQSGQAGDESKTDKRGNAFGRTSIKLGFLLVLICLFFLYQGFTALKARYFSPEPQPDVQQAPQVKPLPSSASLSSQPSLNYKSNQVAQQKKTLGFLSHAKEVILSHSVLVKNKLLFYYRVEFSDTQQVTLTSQDLQKLGYVQTIHTQCLTRLTGSDFDTFVMCAKSQQPKPFAEKLFTSANDAFQSKTPAK